MEEEDGRQIFRCCGPADRTSDGRAHPCLVAASKLTAAGLTPILVQNGIQNSLDNQVIKQMTVIDAKVRSLEAFAANRFGAALNQQILGSLR